jgi:hypothetical protein
MVVGGGARRRGSNVCRCPTSEGYGDGGGQGAGRRGKQCVYLSPRTIPEKWLWPDEPPTSTSTTYRKTTNPKHKTPHMENNIFLSPLQGYLKHQTVVCTFTTLIH